MKELIEKYRSLILYVIFGAATTLVNIVSYWVCAHLLNCSVSLSTAIAWFLSVLFAYMTNRKWVFESRASGLYEIVREMISFFTSRLATGFLDWLIMFAAVEKAGLPDMPVKIASNILVIVLNYILGKFVVFRKR